MNTFKHSGAAGDLIYSLPVVRHFGGGDFYLHLNQMDWIGTHYYGSLPAPFHQGRLTEQDFEYMREFMEAQTYIQSFQILDPRTAEITHNLDRFRTAFVGHPGNYIDIYADTFGIRDPDVQKSLRTTPWLTVPEPVVIPDRPVVINRTLRWLPPALPGAWATWKSEGVEENSVFVGHADEYVAFKQQTGWDIPYHATRTQLELASVIAGAQQFIGNQSQGLALAIGLGVSTFCEIRRDLPENRNECYFADNPQVVYF